MLKAGVDLGAVNTKVAIVDDGTVLALVGVPTGFDQKASTEKALEQAIAKAGKTRKDITQIVATGAGRDSVSDMVNGKVTEISSAAKGAAFLIPSARTVIDAGGEEARAVRMDNERRVKDFAVNERCAAGAGAFVEAMAKALEVSVEELAKISLESTQKVPMNAQCCIFAESEVVTLIHAGVGKKDISRAIHESIADRIGGMARRVGLEKDIVLIGGMGKNPGFVEALKRALDMDVLVPSEPEYVSAIGAAVSE